MKVEDYFAFTNIHGSTKVLVVDIDTEKEYRLYSDAIRCGMYNRVSGGKTIDIAAMEIDSVIIHDDTVTIFAEQV